MGVSPVETVPKRFFADAMLGKLARWLRMMGYDTAYQSDIPDSELTQRVVQEHRWLLTRDGYLTQRKVLRGRHTLIHSDVLLDQLRQLQAEVGLHLEAEDGTPSRCAVCNVALNRVTSEEVAPFVPGVISDTYDHFTRCPQCAKIYWPGSHWFHIQEQLARC